MSQLSLFLALALTAVIATGFSVDSPHVRGGRQMWRGQQGRGTVSQVSHAGNSKRFTSRQTSRQTAASGRHFPSSSHHNPDNDIKDTWFSSVLTDWEIQKQKQQQQKQQQQQGQHPKPPADPKPPASICQAAGFFANPDSCTGFHRCVDWTGRGTRFSIFHFTCPTGTIFDNSLGICNHPWAVGRPECTGHQEPLVVVTTQKTSTVQPATHPTHIWTPSTEKTIIEVDSTSGDGSTAGQGTNSSSTTGPPKPFTLECKQDNSYRRHPLYCNRYYYCIWDSDAADWTFPSFTCPKGLLFDEYTQQCSSSAAECDGILAPTDAIIPPTPKPTSPTISSTSEATGTTFFDIVTSTEQTWEVDPVSSYSCPAPGYYPFEGDCIRFYKCVETEEGKLKGLLYRCPNGYGYNEEVQRCRKEHELPKCTRVMTEALFRVEAARPLYVEDLKWFFIN